MRTALIYSTKHGTTEKVAKYISEIVGSEKAVLLNLKKHKEVNLSEFDYVIIGGSIHAGKIQDRIKKFMSVNEQELLGKPLGLYLCCMDALKFEEQFNNAFPENLRQHAKLCKFLGGEFLLERMNFIERGIIKKIAKINKSVSKIHYVIVDDFVRDFYEEA